MPTNDTNTNKPVQIRTPRLPWRRGLTTNSTQTNALTLLVPTTTEPVTVDDATTPTSNTLVVDCKENFTELAFFGTDADGETCAARVWLWSRIVSGGTTALWVPRLVLDVTATYSNLLNGVAGAVLSATEYIADTLVAGTVQDSLAIPPGNIFSPGTSLANAGIASVVVDTMGYAKLQVEFDIGTAASGNVIYRQF